MRPWIHNAWEQALRKAGVFPKPRPRSRVRLVLGTLFRWLSLRVDPPNCHCGARGYVQECRYQKEVNGHFEVCSCCDVCRKACEENI